MRIFKPYIIYIKISQNDIVAEDFETRAIFRTKPFLTIDEINGRTHVMTIGEEFALKERRGKPIWPFYGVKGFVDHPDAACQLTNFCIQELKKENKWFFRKPRIIVHFVYEDTKDDEDIKWDNVEKNIDLENFQLFIEGSKASVINFKYGREDFAFRELVEELKSMSPALRWFCF